MCIRDRSDPVDIPWEQGCLADIVQLQQAGRKSFQAQAQSAVRRHSGPVYPKIAFKERRIHSHTLHFFQLDGIFMDALSALSLIHI